VSAYTKPRINMYRKTLNWERAKETCGHLADLPPPVPGHCTIGLLIGMDMVKLHLQEEVRAPPPGAIGPCAVKTPLGWSIVGPVLASYMQQDSRPQEMEESIVEPHCFLVCRDAVIEEKDDESFDCSDESLHRLVHHFITKETLGTKPDVAPLVPPKDKKALDFAEASCRNENNVCTIGLP